MNKLDEMWAALAAYQPKADAEGHGETWATMCREKTSEAARAAWSAAIAAGDAEATAYYASEADRCVSEADRWAQKVIDRINKLNEAQPKQEQGEPVGWLDSNDKHAEFMHRDLKAEHDKRGSSTPKEFQIPVYTTPQQRTWVGLTDEEAEAIWEDHQFNGRPSEVSFANRMNLMQAIEAKLKEKNNA